MQNVWQIPCVSTNWVSPSPPSRGRRNTIDCVFTEIFNLSFPAATRCTFPFFFFCRSFYWPGCWDSLYCTPPVFESQHGRGDCQQQQSSPGGNQDAARWETAGTSQLCWKFVVIVAIATRVCTVCPFNTLGDNLLKMLDVIQSFGK